MDSHHPDCWHLTAPSPLSAATAPLVAVLLSLLALWVGATPAPTHAVGLYLAGTCHHTDAPSPGVHTVIVEADKRLFWDGQALADMGALDARMRTLGAVPGPEQPELHVEPRGPVTYGAVVAVLASAQRNGVRTMGVLGEGGFISNWHCATIYE